MPLRFQHLPEVGEAAPSFSVHTVQGGLSFPEFSAGMWCVLLAHPANFTSSWWMYSTFLALKERWFNTRNTKLLTISVEPVRQTDWSDRVRRYLGMLMKSPVIEDLDCRISNRYGLDSLARRHSEFNRLAYIIDPFGVIRMIIYNPLPSIESALAEVERALDQLQGKTPQPPENNREFPQTLEQLDAAAAAEFKFKPAYFGKNKINPN
jgi:peroxiredoxin (alkyl hydroperoxide reductase subunit C)